MLKTYVKIGLTWGVVFGVVFGVTMMLPHRQIDIISSIAFAFDLLVGVFCFFVAMREINRRTAFVFTYLAIFFLFIGLSWSVDALMGKAFFQSDPFANVYWKQYQWAIYYFLLLLFIFLGAMEVVTRKLGIFRKFLLSFCLAGVPFVLLNYPFFLNPNHLYSCPEFLDFTALRQAINRAEEMGSTIPDINQLATEVDLPSQTGSETFAQKLQRVSQIFPYLKGKNYVLFIYRPVYLNALYMSILCLIILLSMLWYSYWNDWPKSAYVEKVLMAFIPICALECFHAYTFFSITNFQIFQQILVVGTILTRISYAFVLFLLVLRLNFISSPAGNFYENKLNTDPDRKSVV